MADRKRCCCNCGNDICTKDEKGVVHCHCAIDGHRIGYVECFEHFPKDDATVHMFGGQRGGGKIFHLETRLAEAIRERDKFKNCARFYRNRCIDLEEKMTRKEEIDSGSAKKEDEDIEKAYQNGKERMREEIINKLRDAKGRALGLQRAVLTDVIEMIRKMEVRP